MRLTDNWNPIDHVFTLRGTLHREFAIKLRSSYWDLGFGWRNGTFTDRSLVSIDRQLFEELGGDYERTILKYK